MIGIAASLIMLTGSANAFTLGFSFGNVVTQFSGASRASAPAVFSLLHMNPARSFQGGFTAWPQFYGGSAARLQPAVEGSEKHGWSKPGEGNLSGLAGLAMAQSLQRNGGIGFLGIDRLASFQQFKMRFLHGFLFGWRFNRWFEHHAPIHLEPTPPAVVPLPAALLLFGSAFLGLMGFRLRSPGAAPIAD